MDFPLHRLAEQAVKVWVISEIITNAIGFMILGLLFYLDWRFTWYEWIGWVLIGLTAIFIAGAVWSLVSPRLTYKSWRYGLDEEFLQLQHGVWDETHQLIPMAKIQSVTTNQGPLMRRYGLYSLSVETMGSSHSIPALSKETAFALRERIAQFAKIKEVEQ